VRLTASLSEEVTETPTDFFWIFVRRLEL